MGSNDERTRLPKLYEGYDADTYSPQIHLINTGNSSLAKSTATKPINSLILAGTSQNISSEIETLYKFAEYVLTSRERYPDIPTEKNIQEILDDSIQDIWVTFKDENGKTVKLPGKVTVKSNNFFVTIHIGEQKSDPEYQRNIATALQWERLEDMWVFSRMSAKRKIEETVAGYCTFKNFGNYFVQHDTPTIEDYVISAHNELFAEFFISELKKDRNVPITCIYEGQFSKCTAKESDGSIIEFKIRHRSSVRHAKKNK